MNNIILSIIIPHFNIPNLLMRCLDSIPEREDVQVIVVDDCSPGYKDYQQMFPHLSRPFLELYQTPKGGSAGRARNRGLRYARGKWVTFMDADDFFEKGAIETFLDSVISYDTDMVIYRTRAVMSDDINMPSNRAIYEPCIDKYFESGDESDLRIHFDSLWGKFIRKDFIDKHKITFHEVKYGNDAYFSAVVGALCGKIYVVDSNCYVVTKRKGSLDFESKKNIKELFIRNKESIRNQLFLKKHRKEAYNLNDIYNPLFFFWHCDKMYFLKLLFNIPFNIWGDIYIKYLKNKKIKAGL